MPWKRRRYNETYRECASCGENQPTSLYTNSRVSKIVKNCFFCSLQLMLQSDKFSSSNSKTLNETQWNPTFSGSKQLVFEARKSLSSEFVEKSNFKSIFINLGFDKFWKPRLRDRELSSVRDVRREQTSFRVHDSLILRKTQFENYTNFPFFERVSQNKLEHASEEWRPGGQCYACPRSQSSKNKFSISFSSFRGFELSGL